MLVDAAGYREQRAVALRATADQAAETAISDRRAVPLEAMSPLERKVIHEHLKGRHDVETYSEGQEPSRRLWSRRSSTDRRRGVSRETLSSSAGAALFHVKRRAPANRRVIDAEGADEARGPVRSR